MVAAETVWQQQIFGTAQSRFDSSFLGQNRDIPVICIESREKRYLSLVCQQFIFKQKYLGIQIPNTGTIWSRLRAEYCRICLKLHPRRKAKNSNSKAKFKKREQFSNQRLSPAGQRYLSVANSCSPTMCWKSAGVEYCAGSLNVPTDRPARRGTLQRLELPTVEAFPLLHWMVQSKSI